MSSSSESSSSSSSSSDSDGGGAEHPMEAAVRRRAAASAATAAEGSPPASSRPAAKSSSPESGEVPRTTSSSPDSRLKRPPGRSSAPAAAAPKAAPNGSGPDLDEFIALAGANSSGSSSGSEGSEGDSEGEEVEADRTEPAVPAPTGVILVESAEDRNAEVQRLLRAPRYFDEDFEEAGLRCFKCGGKGHFARDCTAEARERSCFLCAQFGHDSRDCPNSLCWRCQRPGHMARDCPYGYRAQPSWDESGPAVCLRCGSETCPCAGEKDCVRADGGCKREYSERDLRHVRCHSCGKRGHLSCAPAPTEPAALSCHNCGQGGHTAAECSRELPQVIRGEMAGGGGGGYRGSFDRGGGGGFGGGGGQQSGGYGSRQPRYAAYSAYAEIEQPQRRRSYDDAFDRDGYGYSRQYSGGGDWGGGGKRPRR